MSKISARLEQLERLLMPSGAGLSGLSEVIAWNRHGQSGPRPYFVPPPMSHSERNRLAERLAIARARVARYAAGEVPDGADVVDGG